ncbi:hypothetical protein H7K45_05515 [Mycobacterium yunnanensis]|uniref:Uncharacterized protein n=1 Tax=Mycobacterium yunnanensis TaxID=368477 RepID=A0A9X3BSE8_9MYCO|nr:hypothetical protein [Mycobacterium yunnanensis]MCV7419990.1 hypothetical protein [Mycobacterium yunnanensis]
MSDDLLDLAVDAAGGRELWNTVHALRVDLTVGGPIWGVKGWPAASSFHQIVTVDTRRQHISFDPFTHPDHHLTFDGATDTVTISAEDGRLVDALRPARSSFHGMLRNSVWDAAHLGYFLGYACWNYFTAPFLFTQPGFRTTELSPWHEAGQTWRRLAVDFPSSVATHSPHQVFYFDAFGEQRRMDYVTEVNGSTLVGQYSSRHATFDGLRLPTRRRVFRRNPDDTVNLNMPAITLDVHHVDLVTTDRQDRHP